MKDNEWQLLWYCFLWLVLLFMVALSFYGIFRKGEKLFKTTCHNFFVFILFALLQLSGFNFLRSIQIILFNTFCSNAFFKTVPES